MRAMSVGLAVAVLAVTAAGCKKADDAAKGEAATAGAPAEAAGASKLPQRKAGLWENTITAEGAPAMSTRLCLDAATDAKLSIAKPQGVECSESTVDKTATGYSFSSVCQMGTGGQIKSTGQVSGDFNSEYKIEAQTETTGAAVPQMNRVSKVAITAKWAGPCPEGWQPGDVEMPGGTRINTIAALDAAKAKTAPAK